MGKETGRYFKYNRSKVYTPTLKKPVLSSSAAHTSYAINLIQTFISSLIENEDSNAIQNNKDTSNTDDTHLCVTPRKQNYSVQVISTTNSLTRLNTTVPIAPVELQNTTKLSPVGK